MHKRLKLAALAAAAALLASCSGGTNSVPSTPGTGSAPTAQSIIQSCAQLLPGDDARCFAEFDTVTSGTILKGGRQIQSTANATPSGYGPSDLQSAYALPSSSAGSGQTVAIVDAYDDPNAAGDLSVYRSQYGLPACTISNGCFRKVSQSGSTSRFPKRNGGWAQEESLDMDMVSAICPNCHIILVEASTASNSNLQTAENEAVKLGANVVSNSYGGSESSASNSAYNHPGHVIVASSGDSSYTAGPQQPCSYPTVVCAGGTNLQRASNARGWTEKAWVDAGSGCSAYVSALSWQTATCSGKRPESDVSAVADPNTGVAVYDRLRVSRLLRLDGFRRHQRCKPAARIRVCPCRQCKQRERVAVGVSGSRHRRA